MRKTFLTLTLLLSCFYNYASDFETFIKNATSYQNGVELNDNVMSINNETFSIEAYLNIFDRLSRKARLEYCYSYYNYGMGGFPILFVKDESFNLESYVTEKLILAKSEINEKATKESLRKDNPDEAKAYKNKLVTHITEIYRRMYIAEYKSSSKYSMKNNLIPEDSKMGYLQYLFFHQMGELFASYSHHTDVSLIHSIDELNKIIEYYNVEREEQHQLSPKVILEENRCLITWFESETGIYKRTYEIDRKSPFEVKLITSILYASEKSDNTITIIE